MFSRETIEAIRARCDVLQIIGAHVALKKSGRQYVGLCPFHAEKTPSFGVAPDKGLYHCFGCQAGGNVFDFIMRYQGLDFAQAVRWLADKVGFALEAANPQEQIEQQALKRLTTINQWAQQFFKEALLTPAGQHARTYLAKRGIDATTSRNHGLGFGSHHQAFMAKLSQAGIAPKDAIEAGLLNDNGQQLLLSGRVIFPIVDLQGRVAGFGGRRLEDTTNLNQGPKYINSRETLLFQKSTLLYGLHAAYNHIRRSQTLVLVEGYTDVLAAWRAQVPQAVATLGTALTAQHAALCKRFAQTVKIVLDADQAGAKATMQMSRVLLTAGLKVHVASLPAGEDPDSLVRKRGPVYFRQVLEGTQPCIDYFMTLAFAKSHMNVEQKVLAAQRLQPLLAALGQGLEYDLYMHRLAEKVGIDVLSLQRHMRSQKTPPNKTPRPFTHKPTAEASRQPHKPTNNQTQAPVVGPNLLELKLLRDLLLFPQLRPRLGLLAEYAQTTQMRCVLEELAIPEKSIPEILTNHIKDPIWRDRLQDTAMLLQSQLDDTTIRADRTFNGVLACLQRCCLDTALFDVMQQIRQAEALGEPTADYIRRKQALTLRKRSLKRAERQMRDSR